LSLPPCDVATDENIQNLFTELGKVWDTVDIVVHAIAFAPADQLSGDFIDNVTREGFHIAHDISAYSFCALAKYARPMMTNGGALLTLSYLGAEKSVVNYNTMGPAKAALESSVRYAASAMGKDNIRVNAISAGPIRTLAASGIAGFRKMLDLVAKASPLKRNVTTADVGNAAAFLCSDLAAGITGEVTYVDCGYSTVGVPALTEE
jgi:enoyl-[acyl-carrier protein] reductase I